ncbi:MAG: UDP-2,3-diacylglucosamine diphosphatase, partial [Prolixibacteraceae bacterium]|nr:UDP-2,3-diacylglucosamine diphosphatase [Prolixibacteraceae bacterium]
MEPRKLEISVISDVHLATHASKAKLVLKYLKSIHPDTLILNGDIIDSWRFSRSYFPKPHLKVIRHVIKLMEKGTKVIYISGNHDEFLRKFSEVELGNLKICNQIILELNGVRTWIFHGDIFDYMIHQAKWLAKIGAALKGLLTMINEFLNVIARMFGWKELFIYKTIKSGLIRDRSLYTSFEKAVCEAARKRDCQTVICGHTHVPKDTIMTTESGRIRYLNCGDWVEHFTAAEYMNGEWVLHQHSDTDEDLSVDEFEILNDQQVLQSMYKELVM